MSNKVHTPPDELYTYISITPLVRSLMFGRRKKKELPGQPTQEKSPKSSKLQGSTVAKYEIAENKVKFYVTKGLFKKRWVLFKEFPVYEITAVEFLGNWLSLIWNGTSYPFVLKKKTESFAKLKEQLSSILEEHQKTLLANEKAALRNRELLAVINAVLPIVDSSFDILMGLHEKRVDWAHQETFLSPLLSPLNFRAESLPPLDLDFSKLLTAVKAQVVKETSTETFSMLKAIHTYFTGLKPEDDLAEIALNFENAKAVVLAYITLNDLLLAKTIGEKDNTKEVAYMEKTLKALADRTSFKVAIEQLTTSVDQFGVDTNDSNAVDEARTLFREQLGRF